MSNEARFTSHQIVLSISWLLATGAIVVMLVLDVRHTDQFIALRYILQVVYVAALLWYLSRTGPALNQLPDLPALLLPRWKYGTLVPATGLALLFILILFSDLGIPVLMLVLLVATVWIIIVWRREVQLRVVLLGFAVAMLALLGGLPFLSNNFVADSVFVVLLALTPPMFIAGSLLIKHSGLGDIQLAAGRYMDALRSFLWGCLLFAPLGLTNAASGSPGLDITWVTRLWMPVTLPWFSGIAEETWFRLLLVGLCYLVLRPAFPKQPVIAIVVAVIFSGLTFGLGHGRSLENFLTTGLLYGLPMAVIFARRDWEHAVGAHYVVNMIPWVIVFLET